jgi:hypothetical protein
MVWTRYVKNSQSLSACEKQLGWAVIYYSTSTLKLTRRGIRWWMGRGRGSQKLGQRMMSSNQSYGAKTRPRVPPPPCVLQFLDAIHQAGCLHCVDWFTLVLSYQPYSQPRIEKPVWSWKSLATDMTGYHKTGKTSWKPARIQILHLRSRESVNWSAGNG